MRLLIGLLFCCYSVFIFPIEQPIPSSGNISVYINPLEIKDNLIQGQSFTVRGEVCFSTSQLEEQNQPTPCFKVTNNDFDLQASFDGVDYSSNVNIAFDEQSSKYYYSLTIPNIDLNASNVLSLEIVDRNTPAFSWVKSVYSLIDGSNSSFYSKNREVKISLDKNLSNEVLSLTSVGTGSYDWAVTVYSEDQIIYDKVDLSVGASLSIPSSGAQYVELFHKIAEGNNFRYASMGRIFSPKFSPFDVSNLMNVEVKSDISSTFESLTNGDSYTFLGSLCFIKTYWDDSPCLRVLGDNFTRELFFNNVITSNVQFSYDTNDRQYSYSYSINSFDSSFENIFSVKIFDKYRDSNIEQKDYWAARVVSLQEEIDNTDSSNTSEIQRLTRLRNIAQNNYDRFNSYVLDDLGLLNKVELPLSSNEEGKYFQSSNNINIDTTSSKGALGIGEVSQIDAVITSLNERIIRGVTYHDTRNLVITIISDDSMILSRQVVSHGDTFSFASSDSFEIRVEEDLGSGSYQNINFLEKELFKFVDTIFPSITFDQESSGSPIIIGDSVVNISGMVADDLSLDVTSLSISADYSGVEEIVSYSFVDGGDSKSGSYSASYVPSYPGAFTLKISISDGFGNVSHLEQDYIVDLEAPVISFPFDGVLYTNQENIDVSYSVLEANLDTINAFLNDVLLASSNQNVSISLQDVDNTLKVVATDLAGNTTNSEKQIIYDTDLPYISSFIDSEAISNVAANSNFSIALSDDTSPLDISTITVNMQGNETNNQAYNQVINNIQVDSNPNIVVSGTIPNITEGQYKITVDFVDLAGNSVDTENNSKVVAIDNSDPVILVDPFPTKVNTNNLNLSATIEDISAVNSQVYINEVIALETQDKVISNTIQLNEGVNNLKIISMDSVGHFTTLELGTIEVDTIAPYLSSVTPNDGEDLVGTGDLYITGNISESIVSVKVNDNDADLVGDDSFSYKIPLMVDGEHSFEIKMLDSFGNEGVETLNINLIYTLLNKNLITIVPSNNGNNLVVTGVAQAARDGIEIEVSTGIFNSTLITPNPNGSFSVELEPFSEIDFIASDLTRNIEEEFSLTFSADTTLSGVVLDIDDNPLIGVRVAIEGTSLETYTDQMGTFTIANPVTGDQKVIIDGTTIPAEQLQGARKFSSLAYSVNISPIHLNVIERPIYMTPIYLDGSETEIVNGSAANVTSPYAPGVSLNIPAGTVAFPEGTSSGTISVVEIPATNTTVDTPEFVSPSTVYAFEPSGVTFNEPVDLILPNTNEYPEGTDLIILSKNSLTGSWEVDGVAEVSSGGTEIITKAGMGITHFSEVFAMPLGPQIRYVSEKDRAGADNFSGAFAAKIDLPSFKSLGQDVTPSLVYKSTWAHPTTVVTNVFEIPKREFSFDSSYTIDQRDLTISVDESVQEYITPDSITSQFFTEGIIGEKIKYTNIPEKSVISYGFDISDLSSGIHPYFANYEIKIKDTIIRTVKTVSNTKGDYYFENGTRTLTQNKVTREEILRDAFPSELRGPLYVQNKKNSEFGSGWKLSGVQKILNPDENRILMENYDGSLSTYTINNNLSTVFFDNNGVSSFDSSQWPIINYTDGKDKVKTIDFSSVQNTDNTSGGALYNIAALAGGFVGGYARITGTFNNNYGGTGYYYRCTYSMFDYQLKRTLTGIVSSTNGSYLLNSSGEVILGSSQGTSRLFGQIGGQPSFTDTGYSTNATYTTSQNYCNSNDLITCASPYVVGNSYSSEEQVTNFSPDCGPSNFYGVSPYGEWIQSGSGEGSFASTALNDPYDLVSNPNNDYFYVIDRGNNRIKKVDVNTQSVQTVIGSGSSYYQGAGLLATSNGIYHPQGLAITSENVMYVSTQDGYIRKVDSNGYMWTFAGKNLADGGSLSESTTVSEVALNNPTSLLFDDDTKTLYVSDTGNKRILSINTLTNRVNVLIGNGSCDGIQDYSDVPALDVGLCNPTKIGFDQNKNLVVLDTSKNAVLKVQLETSELGYISYSSLQNDGSELYRHNDGSYHQIYRTGVENVFNNNGLQLETIDRGNRKVVYHYDEQGRLIEKVDPTGSTIFYEYANGLLDSITDPAGRVTTFNYNSGKLIKVNFPDGSDREFIYDGNGLMLQQIDQVGAIEEVTYNEYQRVSKVKDALGYETIIDDSASRLLDTQKNITEDGIELEVRGVDENQLSEFITDANGNTTTYSRDESGHIHMIENASGQLTENIRDEKGRLIKVIKPDGSYRELTYNDLGDLTTEYDSKTDVTVSKAYDAYGNVLEYTNEQGVKVTNTYNSEGMITATTSTEGDSLTQSFSGALGLISSSTNVALGQTTQYEYDIYGNVIKIIDSYSNNTVYERDSAGNITKMTDRNGNITSYSYDSFNRLLSVVTPELKSVTYHYSLRGELVEVVDQNGGSQIFEYDNGGNLVKKIDQKGNFQTMSYDGNKNLIQLIDKGGIAQSFEYDEQNRMVKRTLPNNIYDLIYDDQGNIESVEDSKTKASFTYNEFNKVLTAKTEGVGSFNDFPNVTISYVYDDYGNKIQMNDPTGVTTYAYNNLNYLTGLANHKNEAFSFVRDVEGFVEQIVRPNSSTSLVYDDINFLTSINHTTSTGHAKLINYTRDLEGNRLSISSTDETKSFGYDNDYQLTTATNSGAPVPFQSETFSYDQLGNRLSNGAVYDNSKLQIMEDYDYIYSYDVYGNLTSKIKKNSAFGEGVNYSYDYENRLVAIDYIGNGSTLKEITYVYDVLGRRIAKEVINNEDSTKSFNRRYVYDGSDILLEYNESNELLARYTHSTLKTDDVLAVDVTNKGKIAEVAVNEGSYFYLKDALGSITDITDTLGNIVQKYSYSAFGELIGIKDYSGTDITNNPAMKPFYSFTGRELDQESGLYYYRARYYDASLGRFTQLDPHPGDLSNPLSVVNKYIYVLNNPINAVDPSGLFFKKLWNGVKKTVKKVMKNKVAGFIISGIVSGAVGSLAYVNLSGQFHSNDVAMINLGVAVAAAAVTGGAAGSWAGGLVKGGLAGAALGGAVGAATGAVVGGTVNGSLTTLSGGSFKSGFIQGAIAGAVAGGLAGAYAGYGATGGGVIEDSVSTQMSSQSDPVNVSFYSLSRNTIKSLACIGILGSLVGAGAKESIALLFAIPGYGWVVGSLSIVALGTVTAVACI